MVAIKRRSWSQPVCQGKAKTRNEKVEGALERPDHGVGARGGTPDSKEGDGASGQLLVELDSAGGLSECATTRRGYACEE
jgi:hypothetical protein